MGSLTFNFIVVNKCLYTIPKQPPIISESEISGSTSEESWR